MKETPLDSTNETESILKTTSTVETDSVVNTPSLETDSEVNASALKTDSVVNEPSLETGSTVPEVHPDFDTEEVTAENPSSSESEPEPADTSVSPLSPPSEIG